MHTRPLLLTSLVATVALGLAACTSGEDNGAEPPTDTDAGATGAGATDGAAVTEGPEANGYLCRFVSPPAQQAVSGGELSQPQAVVVDDSAEAWTCEARDGDEGVIRVSYLLGEEHRSEQRAVLDGVPDVSTGPEWLGESFVSPRMVVGLTLCTDPEGTDDRVPFTIVAEALQESDEDVSAELTNVATATARALDQGVGCSPRQARAEASQTEAP